MKLNLLFFILILMSGTNFAQNFNSESSDDNPLGVKIDSVYSIGDTVVTISTTSDGARCMDKSRILENIDKLLRKEELNYVWDGEHNDWLLISRLHIEENGQNDLKTIIVELWNEDSQSWVQSDKTLIGRLDLSSADSTEYIEVHDWNADLNNWVPRLKSINIYETEDLGGLGKQQMHTVEGYGWDGSKWKGFDRVIDTNMDRVTSREYYIWNDRLDNWVPSIKNITNYSDSSHNNVTLLEEYSWDESKNLWKKQTREETRPWIFDSEVTTYHVGDSKNEWKTVAKFESKASYKEDEFIITYYVWDDKLNNWNIVELDNSEEGYYWEFETMSWEESEPLIFLED